MHVAVGDQDRPADPLGRRIRERPAQRGEEPRAVGIGFLARRLDDPDLDVAERRQPVFSSARASSVWRGRSPMLLAFGSVDDHRDDVFQRSAVLLHEVRIEKRQDEEREGQAP